jgi:hypothetical protein
MAAKKPVNPLDAFNAIAKTSTPASKKAAMHPVASSDSAVRKAVDKIIEAKARIASLESELADAEATVIDAVRPQQDAAAFAGNYVKSYAVKGDQGAVLVTTANKFSGPKTPEEIEAARKLLGDDRYDSWLPTSRVIAVKKTAAENQVLMGKILDAVSKAGLTVGDVFDVTDKTSPCENLDEKQYALKPDQLAVFRTLVKQAKPSIKGTSLE